jgi:hypothetical protein
MVFKKRFVPWVGHQSFKQVHCWHAPAAEQEHRCRYGIQDSEPENNSDG